MNDEMNIVDTIISQYDNFFMGAIEFRNKQNGIIRKECSRLLEELENESLLIDEVFEEFNKTNDLLNQDFQKKQNQDRGLLMEIEMSKSTLSITQLHRIEKHEHELASKMKKLMGYKNPDLVNFEKIIKKKLRKLNRKKW